MKAEITDLTLDERGLEAVSKFLKKVVDGEPEPQVPSIEDRQPSIWEPPIDNECP